MPNGYSRKMCMCSWASPKRRHPHDGPTLHRRCTEHFEISAEEKRADLRYFPSLLRTSRLRCERTNRSRRHFIYLEDQNLEPVTLMERVAERLWIAANQEKQRRKSLQDALLQSPQSGAFSFQVTIKSGLSLSQEPLNDLFQSGHARTIYRDDRNPTA